MPRVPQAPPPGVFRNATPEATAGKWWDVNNIRFRGGMLQPIGGNVAQPHTAVADLPRDLLTWHDNARARWAAFGTDTKLYAYNFDLQELHDITPAGVGPLDPPGTLTGYGMADYGEQLYGTEREASDIGPQDVAATLGDRWSMDTFGQDLLVVPTQDGHLYRWSPTTPTTLPALVAGAPTSRGVIVTDQRHVVLLGVGTDPRKIAWSDQEDPDTWIPAVTNLAGDKLLQTQSYAMTAIKVSDGVLIFTANDVHKMSYVGAPYAYGLVQIAAGCGPISLRAVVAIGNFIAWPGTQTFWSYSGGSVQPLKCDVDDWFFSLVNREMVGRVFGSPNPSFSEVWWDWPDEGAVECNRYIAVNYADGTRPWTIGVRERTAGDPTGTMDYPLIGGPLASGGSLYLHEYGWTDNGVARAPYGLVYAESGSITLGEGDKRFHVKQVVLDAAANEDAIGYRFYTREQPFAPDETDTGLYTTIHDGLMDVRFSGRTVRMRMEAREDAAFAIGRPRLEVRPGGRR